MVNDASRFPPPDQGLPARDLGNRRAADRDAADRDAADRPAVDRDPPDRELLERLRTDEASAFTELFSRHADSVRRYAARSLNSPAEADDLTAETFFRVLQAVRRGRGPTEHVRTYLLTVARRVALEWWNRRRELPVEDTELGRRIEPVGDHSGKRADHQLISQAFSSLPERWRHVLWQVEVQGERPAAVGAHLGLSANAVAALAKRARAGLRAAYLQAHLATGRTGQSCRSVVTKLGAFTAGGVRGAEARRIQDHIAGCPACRELHAELRDVCATLRSYAGVIAVPVGALVGQQLLAATPTAGGGTVAAAAGKGALVATRVKLAVSAASVGAVGVLGVGMGVVTDDGPGIALLQPDQTVRDLTEWLCQPPADEPTGATAASRSAGRGNRTTGGVDGQAMRRGAGEAGTVGLPGSTAGVLPVDLAISTGALVDGVDAEAGVGTSTFLLGPSEISASLVRVSGEQAPDETTTPSTSSTDPSQRAEIGASQPGLSGQPPTTSVPSASTSVTTTSASATPVLAPEATSASSTPPATATPALTTTAAPPDAPTG